MSCRLGGQIQGCIYNRIEKKNTTRIFKKIKFSIIGVMHLQVSTVYAVMCSLCMLCVCLCMYTVLNMRGKTALKEKNE